MKCVFQDQNSKHCHLDNKRYKFRKEKYFVFKITDDSLNSTSITCINHLQTVDNLPEYTLKSTSYDDNSIMMRLIGGLGWPLLETGSFEFGYFCKECEVKEKFPNRSNFRIDDLPFAFYNYSFEFKFRFKGSKYWKNITKTFQTTARIPDKAPNQKHFLFAENDKNLSLYWDSMQEKYRNGPDFKYNITLNDGKSLLTEG